MLLGLFVVLRSLIFVIYVGFIYPLLFYTLKKAWELSNSDWGIENLDEKESSSSMIILILAWVVHCIWYTVICIMMLYAGVATLILCLWCWGKEIKYTAPERPISEDLAERMGSWFWDRPTYLAKLTPVYTADINGQHYEAKDEFIAAKLEAVDEADGDSELTSTHLSPNEIPMRCKFCQNDFLLSDQVVWPKCVPRHVLHVECMVQYLQLDFETPEKEAEYEGLHDCLYGCRVPIGR